MPLSGHKSIKIKENDSMLVNGIHHVCIKCTKDKIVEVKKFYNEILGLPILRSWGQPELVGFMLDTGDGIIEVFTNVEDELPQGAIRHFAFKTEDVEKCVEAVRKAGYEITVEPKDVVIPSDPAFPVHVAFCIGPVGEEIEFFKEM